MKWKMVQEFLESEYCWVEDGSGNRLPNAVINGDLSAFLATLPEHVAEPQPEAPKDWSGHEHYGDCHYCEINEQYSKQAACWVCMHLVDCGKVDNWQPRTP